nr:hypothetical protein [Paenibacillus sp. YPD9-1]
MMVISAGLLSAAALGVSLPAFEDDDGASVLPPSEHAASAKLDTSRILSGSK